MDGLRRRSAYSQGGRQHRPATGAQERQRVIASLRRSHPPSPSRREPVVFPDLLCHTISIEIGLHGRASWRFCSFRRCRASCRGGRCGTKPISNRIRSPHAPPTSVSSATSACPMPLSKWSLRNMRGSCRCSRPPRHGLNGRHPYRRDNPRHRCFKCDHPIP